MIANLLIWLACHLLLVIAFYIAWELLETENARMGQHNSHLQNYRPRVDSEGRPNVWFPWFERQRGRPPERPEEIRNGESVVR